MLHWWVGGVDLSIFDYLYGWIGYLETHIASVETVLVYNLGGVSSSKEVNL